MPETPAEAVAPQKPIEGPDWSAVEFHPQCPLCEYDLFGLSAPRCPECGYGFEWRDVLDPRAAEHPYLFEHHPERNIRSYFQTAWHALFPRSFWKSVYPSQLPRIKRLLAFWLVGVIFFTCAMVIMAIAINATDFAHYSRGLAYGSFFGGIDTLGPLEVLGRAWNRSLSFSATSPSFYINVFRNGWMPLLMWPILMFGVLCSFRISLKRARIKSSHVARCIVYAFDPLGWAASACLVTFLTMVLIAAKWPNLWERRYEYHLILFWAGYSLYRLYVAYKFYLRFDHPLATVVSAFVIIALAYANLFPNDLFRWTQMLLHGF